jgi:hypothetical protein
MRKWEGKREFGSRTRRRPIGQDYAAAKDAEVGKHKIFNLQSSIPAYQDSVIDYWNLRFICNL